MDYAWSGYMGMSIDDVCGLGPDARDIVMLDCDDMEYDKVYNLAIRTCNWHNLGGFIILQSSERSYHVVFDRFVSSWEENTKIMAWTAIQSNNKHLWKYVLMQLIKGISTLRASRKGDKPFPEIISRYGSQDNGIRKYLKTFELVRYIIHLN